MSLPGTTRQAVMKQIDGLIEDHWVEIQDAYETRGEVSIALTVALRPADGRQVDVYSKIKFDVAAAVKDETRTRLNPNQIGLPGVE